MPYRRDRPAIYPSHPARDDAASPPSAITSHRQRLARQTGGFQLSRTWNNHKHCRIERFDPGCVSYGQQFRAPRPGEETMREGRSRTFATQSLAAYRMRISTKSPIRGRCRLASRIRNHPSVALLLGPNCMWPIPADETGRRPFPHHLEWPLVRRKRSAFPRPATFTFQHDLVILEAHQFRNIDRSGSADRPSTKPSHVERRKSKARMTSSTVWRYPSLRNLGARSFSNSSRKRR